MKNQIDQSADFIIISGTVTFKKDKVAIKTLPKGDIEWLKSRPDSIKA